MLIKALFEQTTLIFYTKFSQKGCMSYKPELMKITMKFTIFKVIYAPTFILNRLFDVRPNLPKKVISVPKQDK